MITLKSYYHKKQRPVLDAEELGLPIFVLRSNSNSQIEQVLIEIFNLTEVSDHPSDMERINQLTQNAIEAVRNGKRWVDLPTASARVRRLQHEIIRQAELTSHSYGKEPNRHVRVFRG
jgi:predicted RNA-binding protein Jag